MLAQQPVQPHPVRTILGRSQKVIAHQTIRMDIEAALLAGLGQGLEDILPVNVVLEDVLPTVATAHHMANRPGEPHSQPAWQRPRTSQVPTQVKTMV